MGAEWVIGAGPGSLKPQRFVAARPHVVFDAEGGN
jgi:hypothetical protein